MDPLFSTLRGKDTKNNPIIVQKMKKMTKKTIQLQFNCFILIFDLNNPYSRNFLVQRLFGWCWCQRHWSTIPWQDEAVPEEISRLIPPYFSKYVTISKNRVFFLLICSFQLPHPRTPAHQNAHAATLAAVTPRVIRVLHTGRAP